MLTGWSKDLRVIADGDGVVAMVGVAGLRMLAGRRDGLLITSDKAGVSHVHGRLTAQSRPGAGAAGGLLDRVQFLRKANVAARPGAVAVLYQDDDRSDSAAREGATAAAHWPSRQASAG